MANDRYTPPPRTHGPGGNRPHGSGQGPHRHGGGNGNRGGNAGANGPSSDGLLPLYKGADTPRPNLADDSHGGLWFDRFFDAYRRDPEKVLVVDKDKKGSRQDLWLTKLAGSSANPRRIGDSVQLGAYRERLERLVAAQGGETRVFASDWNFATGMGLPHPLENGLAWHPMLGVPYLAGAGVKGLLRAFFEEWTDLEDNHPGLIQKWFGPNQDSAEKNPAAGDFVFFDAVPVEPPALTVDVMTPHMGDWYAEGGKIKLEHGQLPPDKVPADWHSPVPVKFLAVKDVRLLFAIAPRCRSAADADGLETLLKGLGEALRLLGAGAKTAAGYGRFG
jgi:CRISPR-associated protein Cmr6